MYTLEAGGGSGETIFYFFSGIIYRQQNGSIHFVTRF